MPGYVCIISKTRHPIKSERICIGADTRLHPVSALEVWTWCSVVVPFRKMDSLFQLPDELVLATLVHLFPCRDLQINALATLLFVSLTALDISRATDANK